MKFANDQEARYALKSVDTLLFLGAGASHFAGYHTFRRFGELILNDKTREQEGLPKQADETPRLINSLNQALSAMKRPTTHDNYLWLLNDYETFCGKFDTHSGLQERFPRIRDEIHSFKAVLLTVINDITQTTYCHYSRKRDTGEAGVEVRKLYEQLAIQNNKDRPFLPIFTTNYDLLLEDLFDESIRPPPRVKLRNGINGRTGNGAKWNRLSYTDCGIHLYRLHGCVGWFNESRVPSPSSSVVFNRPGCLDSEALARLCVMFPGREIEIGDDPHGHSFRTLYYSLLTCRRIIFIGFSFRDDDVMKILLAANARRKKPLLIVVIDPGTDADKVLTSLQGAASRSTFLTALPPKDHITRSDKQFGEPGSWPDIQRFLRETQ